jgi:hypothetical protein
MVRTDHTLPNGTVISPDGYVRRQYFSPHIGPYSIPLHGTSYRSPFRKREECKKAYPSERSVLDPLGMLYLAKMRLN